MIIYFLLFLSILPMVAWPFGNRILYAFSIANYSALALFSFYLVLADYTRIMVSGKHCYQKGNKEWRYQAEIAGLSRRKNQESSWNDQE